jgi:hypothetical protein
MMSLAWRNFLALDDIHEDLEALDENLVDDDVSVIEEFSCS